jgi:acetate---CoA ligase (ADP-forming)
VNKFNYILIPNQFGYICHISSIAKIKKKSIFMLNNIFNPSSIALIGASTQPNTVGNDILKNLITEGYAGNIYPINPKADSILELKAYPSILDLPEIPEMAIIAVPSKIVPSVMEQIAQKGVKGVVIISAGFKEIGEEGQELENQVAKICTQNNITLIGPNCLGVITPKIKMNASFAASIPPNGNIAFLSQSGAICTTVIDLAKARGLGFSKFISLGNKTLCKEVELIQYLDQDLDTKVIMIYAEMLENAPELIRIMSSVKKPVIVLKSGKTEAGASASASHTGALASGDILFDTLFRQANIIRAETMQEMFDIAIIFSRNEIKKIKNCVIITNAGGPGVLTTDALVENGLELATISQETEVELKKYLPAFANFSNPIDLIGDAKEDRYQKALEILASRPEIDSLLVILTPQTTTKIVETAQAIIDIKDKINKPIVASFIGSEKVQAGIDILTSGGIACCSFPDQAGVALAKVSRWTQNEIKLETQTEYNLEHKKVQANEIFDIFRAKNESYIPESKAKEVMSYYGIHSAKSKLCHNKQEAEDLINSELQGKLVMKIISPDIMHKSDVGGVMIGIEIDEAGQKFDEMMSIVSKKSPNSKLEGILFAEMIDLDDGCEFILGAKKDPNLGTAIMVGLGGIYVEIFKDVVFGFPPLASKEIDIMLDSLQSKHILEGARGQDPLDIDGLKQAIQSMSNFLQDFPEVEEVDLNPILVMKKGMGVKTLDAKIVFKI